ncbi:MAG: hypothetical protein U0790_19650 [Isosphaeraceae bacterium]
MADQRSHPRLSDLRSGESGFRRVVRKSALLNLAIVLTSFPVLAWAGGANGLRATLAIMAGISLLIWASTFTFYSFASLTRLFRTREAGKAAEPRGTKGVSDRWLDGPA